MPCFNGVFSESMERVPPRLHYTTSATQCPELVSGDPTCLHHSSDGDARATSCTRCPCSLQQPVPGWKGASFGTGGAVRGMRNSSLLPSTPAASAINAPMMLRWTRLQSGVPGLTEQENKTLGRICPWNTCWVKMWALDLLWVFFSKMWFLIKCSLYHLLLANSLLNIFTNTKSFTWH